ncbi:MAG: hypothetical protein EHM28_12735 [Spirochaetaceae bacterium]|nr:MAG: hypothetical protein EHM28_12735 [Spirochaetaceae bacterium]
MDLPCRLIFSCWESRIPLREYLLEFYTEEQLILIDEPPASKLSSIVELAQMAKKGREDQHSGYSDIGRCEMAFSADLESVGECPYYLNNQALPPAGTRVIINLGARVCIQSEDGVLLGYLPAIYNYLVMCISSGYMYSGTIASASFAPHVAVRVDIAPVRDNME